MFEDIWRATFLVLYLFYASSFAKKTENVILTHQEESKIITKDNINKFAQSADNIGRSLEYLTIADVHDVKVRFSIRKRESGPE